MAHSRAARISVGTAAVTAALTIGAPAAALAATGPAWHIAHRFAPHQSYAFYRSVAVSGSHAWAVGGYGVAGNGLPAAAYFSHGRWSASRVPGSAAYVGTIAAVSADSPTDAWAVSPGAVLHWRDGRWTIAKRWNLNGGPPGPFKSGITALSPSNVWVFGGTWNGNHTWHLHGRTWTQVKGAARTIFSASAISPGNMWAIAGASVNVLLHYSGGTWREVSSPALKGLAFGSIYATRAGLWVTASPAGRTGLELLHLGKRGRWSATHMPWSLPLSTVNPGGLPIGGLSPDGRGGFWFSAYSTGANCLLHVSSAGRWSRARIGRDEVGGFALVPRSTSLWAVGSIPSSRGQYPFTFALIWAYGKAA
jgi:hypothetical protein